MADIELVIKIPEKAYESCKKEFKNLGENELIGEYEYAIANGTLLPKGHWVEHNTPNSTYYDCSLCGCVAPCTEFADGFLWKLSNFCPDCGADMRADKSEEDGNDFTHNYKFKQ